ncbi:hypothetical protein [Paenibacillus turpanensis]|uniref:hypothetical protein n=1 Tax=Paenibacillus turpanensis TaxID=2689078 RepID=UPI00140E0614|nr:hypothetical protein [Paenibacillus turpanensis]
MTKFAKVAATIFIIGVIITILQTNMGGWIGDIWDIMFDQFDEWIGGDSTT